MMAQQRLYPDIPTEFTGVALKSNHHLLFPAEEEEIIDENAASEAAAANAEIPDDDLPSALTNYGFPDLVEADSSDDESDDDDDDSDDNSNDIPGVPVNAAPTVT